MPDHIRDDMPWEQIARDAYEAFYLSHSPRVTPPTFASLALHVQFAWQEAAKKAVESYMANDIPAWEKNPPTDPRPPAPEEYDPNDFVGGAG